MADSVFISADHGTAIIYFLESDVVRTLVDAGLEVVLLTDEAIKDRVAQRFELPGLQFEALRLRDAETFARTFHPRLQWLLGYLRRVGGSWRINTAAMDSHIWEVWAENSWRFRLGVWMPAAVAVLALRSCSSVRAALKALQRRWIPRPRLYSNLFAKYEPALVISSSAGWRLDRYLLREAAEKGIATMAAIVGWDNPSSYAIPGADLQWATCWSELQKAELVLGSDWQPDRVHVGGIPSYDGYLRESWLRPRGEYFRLHGLDPNRKLISYASSFVHFAPNYPNIEALAGLVASDALAEPCQLLIRLHPSHFQDKPAIFRQERERVQALAATLPNVHVVQPVPLGGSLGYYGGEDMDEKACMLRYSDVMVTVYSTMLVEAAIHDTPLIAAVLDVPGGWNRQGKYSLPLRSIGDWPTHKRFRDAGAGVVADSAAELRDAINRYIKNPAEDREARREFVKDEITFTDGTAGRRTAAFILSVLGRGPLTQELPRVAME